MIARDPHDRPDLIRKVGELERRVRDLELKDFPMRADIPTSGTYLRATWCGGGGSEVDFDGSRSNFEKLLTFEEPSAVEQTGGFVFSDHPDAESIDWDDPGSLAPANHHLHRIAVPEPGLYTVIVNYFWTTTFVDDDETTELFVPWIEVETVIRPDTVRHTTYYGNADMGDLHPGFNEDQTANVALTVELDPDTPFWITCEFIWPNSPDQVVSTDQQVTRVSDASITVFK